MRNHTQRAGWAAEPLRRLSRGAVEQRPNGVADVPARPDVAHL